MNPFESKVVAPIERAQQLLAWLLTQPLEGYEKSFKISEATLLTERYLAGIHGDNLSQEQVLGTCRALDMPDPFLERLPGELTGADTVHFGFEQGIDSAIFKLYFEYWGRLDVARARNEDSFVLHRAFKWDALNSSRCSVASYRCYPRLLQKQVLARINRLYPEQAPLPVLELAHELMKLTAARSGKPAMYLEVSETDNPRASFDLNFHAAESKLAAIEPQLTLMARRHSIPAEQFAAFWQELAAKSLGHVSGGTSRDGLEFLTVYYDPLS